MFSMRLNLIVFLKLRVATSFVIRRATSEFCVIKSSLKPALFLRHCLVSCFMTSFDAVRIITETWVHTTVPINYLKHATAHGKIRNIMNNKSSCAAITEL